MSKTKTLTKKAAKDMFGGVGSLAGALQITPEAIHQWPDQLSFTQSCRVVGAAVLSGMGRRVPIVDMIYYDGYRAGLARTAEDARKCEDHVNY